MRPGTSNPKRKGTLSSPTHQDAVAHAASMHDEVARQQLLTRLPIEDITAEVLWSSESTVPSNILARPHTSNPRYVEMNQRDTPRKEAPPLVGVAVTAGPSSSTGATSTSLCATPSDKSSDQQQRVLSDVVTGVLWASESESIDPALIARPVTANPWLRRLFESGAIPEANWSNKGPQILWSSIDVEDWRMLARPHASNPLLERAVADSAAKEESSPVVAHTASEVLWQREEGCEDDHSSPRAARRSTQHADIAPSNSNATAEEVGELKSLLHHQTKQISSLENQINGLHSLVHDMSALLRNIIVPLQQPAGPAAPRAPQSIAPQSRPDLLLPTQCGTQVLNTTPVLNSSIGECDSLLLTYVPDPSPLSTTIPRIRADYPPHQAPSPPRPGYAAAPPPQAHHNEGLAAPTRIRQPTLDARKAAAAAQREKPAGDDSFVVEDTSAVEPRLEGLDDDVTPHKSHGRPESAQLVRGSDSQAASRKVHTLRDVVGSSRPQSAPLSTYGSRGTSATTTFSKDASNALLLNNKAIIDQYQKLLRSNQPYALKADFKDMYRAKYAEFGIKVSEKELDGKLRSFHSTGSEYLSFEEFAVLYLHIAQW